MPLQIEIGGQLAPRLAKLRDPDFRPLMARWQAIMAEDNRRGVMAGIGGDDKALTPVKYRTGVLAPLKRRNRYGRGIKGPQTSSGDNLTSSQYRRLTGPPLAPRGLKSRVITNFVTRFGRDEGIWYVEAGWLNVVNAKGVPFLRYHFNAHPPMRLPRRDLRGLRQWGRDEATRELSAEVRRLLKGSP